MVRRKIGIADIAVLAGLSRTTVDRVLNGRTGVRPETARRVLHAAQQLGYATGEFAALLDQPGQTVEILLPDGTNPFFEQLWAGFRMSVARNDVMARACTICGIDVYNANHVACRLRGVDAATKVVILVGVDVPEVQDAIDELVAKGKRVVTIISDVPQSRRQAYVGQENFAVGRTAARLMMEVLPLRTCSVAVLIGHLHHRHLLDRLSGFRQVLGIERSDIRIIQTRPYGTDPANNAQIIEELNEAGKDLLAVYIAGGGQPHLVEHISKNVSSKPVIIGHEATHLTRTHLQSGLYHFVLAHDVCQLASLALEAGFDEDRNGSLLTPINIHVQDNFPKLLHNPGPADRHGSVSL